jgi:hypothetical protein
VTDVCQKCYVRLHNERRKQKFIGDFAKALCSFLVKTIQEKQGCRAFLFCAHPITSSASSIRGLGPQVQSAASCGAATIIPLAQTATIIPLAGHIRVAADHDLSLWWSASCQSAVIAVQAVCEYQATQQTARQARGALSSSLLVRFSA